jgi:hypothetical protein
LEYNVAIHLLMVYNVVLRTSEHSSAKEKEKEKEKNLYLVQLNQFSGGPERCETNAVHVWSTM